MTNADINAAIDGKRGQDILLNTPEISIWMTACGCLRELADIQAAHAAKKIVNESYYRSINAMLVELAETADLTHRFGVLLPSAVEPHYKKRVSQLKDAFIKVEFSPSFWRWYNWWDDYMKAMDQDSRNKLYQLVTFRLPDVETFRPEKDWISYRKDPAFVLSL